jgi:hypothetical protein
MNMRISAGSGHRTEPARPVVLARHGRAEYRDLRHGASDPRHAARFAIVSERNQHGELSRPRRTASCVPPWSSLKLRSP